MKRTYHAPKVEILAINETQNIMAGSGAQKYNFQFKGYELKDEQVSGRDLILQYGGYGDPGTARTPKHLDWDDLGD